MSFWPSSTAFLWTLLGLTALMVVSRKSNPRLDFIPAIGPSGFLTYYVGMVLFLKNAVKMMQEGYAKYPDAIFRVPSLHDWVVVVSGRDLIEDVRSAKEEVLSLNAIVNDSLQFEFTIGRAVAENPWHATTVRSALTRNFGDKFPEVRDEITTAFKEMIPAQNDWIKITAHKTVMQIISRTSNRLFVGLPICRDPDYVNLNIDFTVEVAKSAFIINLFPPFLKRFVGKLVCKVPTYVDRAVKHLGPSIIERIKQEDEEGRDRPNKPNDLITWLLEDAPVEERSVYDLAVRVLTVNFAAIHTTSMTFTQMLFDLAARPEYCQPLREEVEAAVQEEGWTKATLDRMPKIDSFVRESLRMYGISSLAVARKARTDFTFSNGVTLPAGTTVGIATYSTHHDEKKFQNPHTFNPFRFSEMRLDDSHTFKHQAVTTGNDFLAFGHGRHACPGRFFAVAELKALLAHVVSTYDVKLENEGVRPKNISFGTTTMPNSNAEVLFRKRRL